MPQPAYVFFLNQEQRACTKEFAPVYGTPPIPSAPNEALATSFDQVALQNAPINIQIYRLTQSLPRSNICAIATATTNQVADTIFSFASADPDPFIPYIMTDDALGPTGEICFDLPSPFEAHPCGLLYLPRFIAKCRKHLAGELPKSYQKNFCRGLDRFLSMHLGIDPQQVLDAVKLAGDDNVKLDRLLNELFPEELNAAEWNRELTRKGKTKMGREFLAESLTNMGHPEMIGVIDSVIDMIDFDEGRIPGFSDQRRKAWQASQAE